MNAVLVLTILSLAMSIYGEETQVKKKQEKRGLLGLGYGGLGNTLIAGGSAYGGYGQSPYLGGVASAYSSGHAISAPAYGYNLPLTSSHGYNTPLYSSYSGGLGYGASLGGHGAGLGYGIRGLGYGAGIGYNAGPALGYGAGLGHGLGAGLGYGHGY